MTPPPKLPSRKRATSGAARPKAREMFGQLSDGRLREVPVELIDPNPHQPRQRFEPEALDLLAQSIESRGLLHPPLCRPTSEGRYELIAGERRWRAVGQLGWPTVEILIKETDETTTLEDALIENTARADLSPIEEARAYATLVEDLGLSAQQVGQRVGRSRASVANHIRLLDLPEEALELIDTGTLSFAHGRELLGAQGDGVRAELAGQAAAQGWSSRQLASAVAQAATQRPVRRPVPAGRKKLASELQDAFRRTDPNVSVRAAGDDRFTITVQGVQAARALARRLEASEGS